MPTDYSRQIAMSTNIIGISYKLYYGLLVWTNIFTCTF
jgi:hypothetical protein